MFVGNGGKCVKSCKNCRDNKTKVREQEDASYNLDEHFETHEDFIEVVKSFLERYDKQIFSPEAQSLKLRVTLSESFMLGNVVSVALRAQTEDRELQRQAASHLRNDIFDCSGYYFHLRRCKERAKGSEFILTCSRSQERETELHPQAVQRYTTAKESFACHGELLIAFLKENPTAIITYEHKCHTETPKFHVTEEVQKYIQSHQQQVYNIWLSLTRKEWERDAADDFRSAQLLLEGQEGYRLIEGLQEPGVSLGFITPCFSDSLKYDRAKMTELFIDSTFGLNPNVVHTDKALQLQLIASVEVTAASLAFKRNNERYNQHLCLWHSLLAIYQYITGKMKSKGFDSIDNTRNSTRLTALPQHLHFLSVESDWILSNGQSKQCTRDQARTLHRSSSIKEMLEYCKSIVQPKLFRNFWNNCVTLWPAGLQRYDSNFANDNAIGESLEIVKKDYASRFVKPRLDVLTYIVCTG
ncbi:hypothetical protein V1515DRAFT_639229 [Lipomyces mesembrius]